MPRQIKIKEPLKSHYKDHDVIEVGLDESGRGCEFEDALVLTDNGWKRYNEISLWTDKVFSYTDKHEMIWQEIDDIMDWDVKEELISMKHRSVDILVTEDHHFDVLTKKCNVKRKKVTDLAANDKIPLVGKWNGSEAETFTLPSIPDSDGHKYPELKINMDDWLAFLGFYLSEGCSLKINGEYTVTGIIPENREKIKQLLKKLPFKIFITDIDFYIHNKQLYTYLHQLDNGYSKYIPDFYKNLSSRQCNILMDWLITGNQHERVRMGMQSTEQSRRRYYYTSSVFLKDDIEELALKCNYGFSTIKTPIGKVNYIKGKKVTATTDNYQITLRISKSTIIEHLKPKKVYKEGKVFCLQLPKYHNFYVKRNGKGYFTGNSYISRVYAGAAIWDPEISTSVVRDSKELGTHRNRLIAYDFIKEHCPAYGVGWAELEEIEKFGMTQANLLAMYRAIDACQIAPQFAIIDGADRQFNLFRYNNSLGDPISYKTVEKGDTIYSSIAAASVIAKVERDLYIEQLCDEDPQLDLYEIRSNKGYGSAKHEEALAHWGLTKHHRKTWSIGKRYSQAKAD